MARKQDTVDQYLRDHDRFYQRIWQNDDVGAVIRGVTYCEEFLRGVILKGSSAPSAADVDKMMFGTKIYTAERLRVVDVGLIASLRKLSNVRGGFGHELEKELGAHEVDELVDSLSGRAKEFFEQIQGGTETPASRLRWALQSLKLTLEELAFPERRYSFVRATLDMSGAIALKVVKPDGSEIAVDPNVRSSTIE